MLAADAQVLRLTASHGFAVAALVAQLGRQGITVDIKYRSSTEAVAALARGECDLAGFHLPVGQFEDAAAAAHRLWLDPDRHAFFAPGLPPAGPVRRQGQPATG